MCGLEYDSEHICASAVATGSATTLAAPQGFALWHYLGLAWRIVRWDDAAIREVMDDPHALPYGVLIWAVANGLPIFVLLSISEFKGKFLAPLRILAFTGLSLIFAAIYGLVQMGICRLLARYFCAGDGKFIQIIRPLLLASIVYSLLLVPFAGSLVAAIAWVAVMMMVFQEVHGIEPLTAFLLSAGVGVALKLISYYFLHTPF